MFIGVQRLKHLVQILRVLDFDPVYEPGGKF